MTPHVTVVSSQIRGFVDAINRVDPEIPAEEAAMSIARIVEKVPDNLLDTLRAGKSGINVQAYAVITEVMADARKEALTLH